MAVNITVNNKQIKEDIKVTSIVKSKSGCAVLNSESLFMILDDINEGCYRLVNIKNGVIIASKYTIVEMVKVYELELVTNDIDIVLR